MNEELQRYNIYRGNLGNETDSWEHLNKIMPREFELISKYLKEFLPL